MVEIEKYAWRITNIYGMTGHMTVIHQRVKTQLNYKYYDFSILICPQIKYDNNSIFIQQITKYGQNITRKKNHQFRLCLLCTLVKSKMDLKIKYYFTKQYIDLYKYYNG